MIEIIIEKNIPLKASGTTRSGIVTAMRAMVIGDSFQLPISYRSAVHISGKRAIQSAKFAARKISETEIRVWRIA